MPTNPPPGGVPTTVNPGATAADDLIKQLEDLLVPGLNAALAAALPVLEAPIISLITGVVEKYIEDHLTQFLELGATFMVIDAQVAEEESNMEPAEAALDAAEKSGDPNAIKEAMQEFADDQSHLVHDDGSARPK